VKNVQGGRLLRVGTEAGWVIAGQLLAFLGGFAIIKVLTAELGPAAYGQLALGMSIAGVLHMFLYGPIEQTALRYVSNYRERGRLGQLFALLAWAHKYAAIWVIAFTAVAAVFVHIFAGLPWTLLVLIASSFGIAGGINVTLSSLQTAFRHRRAVAIFQAGEVWLRLGLATAGLALVDHTANAALLGFALATAGTAAAQLLWLIRNPEVQPHLGHSIHGQDGRQARTELLAYGSPYVAFAGFAWLASYSDRWIILMFSDEHSVGIFAALLQIANAPIALFLGITNQFLVPLIFDRAGTAKSSFQTASSARLLGATAVVYVLTLFTIIATAAIFAEPIVKLLTNAQFAQHADLLWILCAGLGLASTGQLLVVKGLSQNRSREYVLPKFVQVAMLLISAPFLVAYLGLTGMALALCISGATYLLAVALTNRHFFRVTP
jgi:O-antigen/teichoic acid export membrane protein